MVGGMKVYIAQEDVLNKLSKEDREKYNHCYFTDVQKDEQGTEVTITCLLFNDSAEFREEDERRYRLFCDK